MVVKPGRFASTDSRDNQDSLYNTIIRCEELGRWRSSVPPPIPITQVCRFHFDSLNHVLTNIRISGSARSVSVSLLFSIASGG